MLNLQKLIEDEAPISRLIVEVVREFRESGLTEEDAWAVLNGAEQYYAGVCDTLDNEDEDYG